MNLTQDVVESANFITIGLFVLVSAIASFYFAKYEPGRPGKMTTNYIAGIATGLMAVGVYKVLQATAENATIVDAAYAASGIIGVAIIILAGAAGKKLRK